MSNWRSLERRLDSIVDQQFGEPVELHPWVGSDVSSEGHPDPSRPVVKSTRNRPVIGVLVTPGARVIGESGMAMANGVSAKQLSNDVWVSLEESLLGDLANWRKYDRIFFPERPVGFDWFSWEYALPSATGRVEVHMIRLSPVSVT